MDPLQRRMAASRRRSLATVKRTIDIVKSVIRQNRQLAGYPGHQESAEKRIRDGNDELSRLEDERRNLERSLPPD